MHAASQLSCTLLRTLHLSRLKVAISAAPLVRKVAVEKEKNTDEGGGIGAGKEMLQE